MKKITLDAKSWHGRLAFTYANLGRYEKSYNFCQYWRKVLEGLFIVLAMTLAAAGFLIPIVDTLVNLIVFLQTGVFDTRSEFFQIFMFYCMIAAVIGGGGTILYQIASYKDRKRYKREQKEIEWRREHNAALDRGEKYVPPPEPEKGFLRLMIESWSQKICVQVEIKNLRG